MMCSTLKIYFGIEKLVVLLKNKGFKPTRNFHSALVLNAGQDWRKKQGLPANPNAYGPLTDGPDYSFIDGRATPAGPGKVKRALEQREIATKILQLSKEVDFALEHHQKRLKDSEEAKNQILNRKLKPKGNVSS